MRQWIDVLKWTPFLFCTTRRNPYGCDYQRDRRRGTLDAALATLAQRSAVGAGAGTIGQVDVASKKYRPTGKVPGFRCGESKTVECFFSN